MQEIQKKNTFSAIKDIEEFTIWFAFAINAIVLIYDRKGKEID